MYHYITQQSLSLEGIDILTESSTYIHPDVPCPPSLLPEKLDTPKIISRSSSLPPYISVYRSETDTEPITTYGVFTGTLDYIFTDQRDINKIESVEPLVVVEGYLPNEECGSDHLPVSCIFNLE